MTLVNVMTATWTMVNVAIGSELSTAATKLPEALRPNRNEGFLWGNQLQALSMLTVMFSECSL